MAGRLFPPRRVPPEGEVDLRTPLTAFGRYDLLEKIGEGAKSETFVARSDGFEGLFRLNALRRMKPALCSDVAIVSRFIEEARLAVRVEHPGTVGVDDFGRVGGVYFIAHELVDGVSLEELIAKTSARGITIDPRVAAHIVKAVAVAVHAVHDTKGSDGHALGLVHGDLQPKNVLLSRDGRVKVKGFAAPSIHVDASQREAAIGVAGLAHQAPEVFDAKNRGDAPNARSDVWSLGVLLFELLVGGRLFPGSRADDVITAVRTVPIHSPARRRAGVPTLLEAIVDEALQRNPTARAEDAARFAESLSEYLGGASFGEAEYIHALHDLDAEDTRGTAVGQTRVMRVTRSAPAPVELPAAPPKPPSDPLVDQLARDPGIWGLVRLGERAHHEGKRDDGRAMFRTAAILFASRGLLAHALCAYDGARATLPPYEVVDDLQRLAEVAASDTTQKQSELRRVGGLAFHEALRTQTDGGVDKGAMGASATPFLSALAPDAFARLGLTARIRRVPAGAHVLREGEPGDSLFAVGEGRLVVTCTPSRIDAEDGDIEVTDFEERTDPGLGVRRVSGVVVVPGLEAELRNLDDENRELAIVDPRQVRVFLSALTAGDLFGEFSFLTGRPRSASVEAVTSCRLVEITRRSVGAMLDENPSLRDALEAFYKERVLEWMLAKNEVFSLLEPDARRSLLAQCGVYDIPAGKVVVREGELHDAMYFIKKGEVEVTLDDNGVQVFINKLGPGEFFGEIAALEGGPRRASVRAVTDLEVFRIGRGDLQHALADAPDVRARLEQAMRARSAELRRRIAEQRTVLAST